MASHGKHGNLATSASKEEKDEKKEDYLEELIEAKMEQAEIRFKSSWYWIFKKDESNILED